MVGHPRIILGFVGYYRSIQVSEVSIYVEMSQDYPGNPGTPEVTGRY